MNSEITELDWHETQSVTEYSSITQWLMTELGIKLKSQVQTLYAFTNWPCAEYSRLAKENQHLLEFTDPLPKMLIPHLRGVLKTGQIAEFTRMISCVTQITNITFLALLKTWTQRKLKETYFFKNSAKIKIHYVYWSVWENSHAINKMNNPPLPHTHKYS